MFPKPMLDRYRQAVVDKKLGAELKKVVQKVSDHGYLVDGQHYFCYVQKYSNRVAENA